MFRLSFESAAVGKICPDKMGCRQLPLFVQTFKKGLDKDKKETTFCPVNKVKRVMHAWTKTEIVWIWRSWA
jgi:hypothetical protein